MDHFISSHLKLKQLAKAHHLLSIEVGLYYFFNCFSSQHNFYSNFLNFHSKLNFVLIQKFWNLKSFMTYQNFHFFLHKLILIQIKRFVRELVISLFLLNLKMLLSLHFIFENLQKLKPIMNFPSILYQTHLSVLFVLPSWINKSSFSHHQFSISFNYF